VKFQADGLSFDIDFRTGKWDATIKGAQFKTDMAPKRGTMKVKLLVGGGLLSDEAFVLQQFTTDLKYSG